MPTKAEVEKELADLKASSEKPGEGEGEGSGDTKSHKSQAEQDDSKKKKTASETTKAEVDALTAERKDDKITVGDDGGDAGGDAGGDDYQCADCQSVISKGDGACGSCGSRLSWDGL